MPILNSSAGLTRVERGLTSYNPYDPTAAKYFTSATPSLYGNFAVTKSTQTLLPSLGKEGPALTLLRGSSGTYVDYDGLIKTAGNSVPRFTHNQTTGECLGLLVEEQRTNYIFNSTNTGGSPWAFGTLQGGYPIICLLNYNPSDGQPTISPGLGIAPDGSLRNVAYNFDSSTAGCSFGIIPQLGNASAWGVTTPEGGTTDFTFSVWLKNHANVSNPELRVLFYKGGNTTTFDAVFNANTGVATQSTVSTTHRWTTLQLKSIPYPNGWYRFVVSGRFERQVGQSDITNFDFHIFNDVSIWGPQLEVGAFETSYIPTTGSAATRSADQVSLALNYEASRTNLFTRSQELNLSPWSPNSVTITANADTAPDLTVTAERITNTPNQLSFISRGTTLNYNTTYTVSIFAKNVSGNGVVAFELQRITKDLSTGYDVAVFNIVNQTISDNLSSNSQIISVGNGWYRLVTTVTTPSSGTYSGPPRFNVIYIGAYGPVSTTNTVALWGAQLEIGSTVSSYIPTTSTTATRPGPSTSGNWFDITKTSGTTYFEYDLLYDQATGASATQGLYGIYDSTSTYSNGRTAFIDVEYNSSVNQRPRTRIKDTVSSPNTETNVDLAPATFSSGMNKLMVGFDSSTFRASQNGSTSSTTNTVNLSVLATRTNTALTFNGSSQYSGSKIIKRFIYWDQLLSSGLFTSLTS